MKRQLNTNNNVQGMNKRKKRRLGLKFKLKSRNSDLNKRRDNDESLIEKTVDIDNVEEVVEEVVVNKNFNKKDKKINWFQQFPNCRYSENNTYKNARHNRIKLLKNIKNSYKFYF